MTQRMLAEVGGVVAMKDPTRGGLADALNEWSGKSRVGILIHEAKVPIREDVQTACEMLGLDPLEVGNEGKMIIGTVPAKAQQILQFLKQTSEGLSINAFYSVESTMEKSIFHPIPVSEPRCKTGWW